MQIPYLSLRGGAGLRSRPSAKEPAAASPLEETAVFRLEARLLEVCVLELSTYVPTSDILNGDYIRPFQKFCFSQ